ncbi:MAG: ABC transporter permease subunit [bacterium]
MMNALRAESYKLRRRGMLLGTFGIIVGMSLLIATILFATAKPQAQIVADAIASAGQAGGRNGPGISFETLEKADGFATAFQFAAQIIGVVCLVVFAQSFGSEYGQGTLKVLFSQEPRRLRVLAGKVLALAALVIGAVLVAFVLQTALVILIAKAKGIDTSAWWTAHAALDGTMLVLRVAAAAMAWGAMGTFLAVLLRAAPPAIGIGIGYTLLVEGILAFALKGATKWLPGQALQSFVGWGSSANAQTSLLPAGWACVAVAAYTAAFLIASGILFARRDVTS